MPITPLPSPPSRADDPTTFASKADALLAALPTFVTEINALGIDAAGAYAAQAVVAAAEAVASANYVGSWSALTGTLNVPASVSHDGNLWLLLTDLADVTASEPGPANADWRMFRESLRGVENRSSNTELDLTDWGSVINTTGNWTQTIASAANLAAGWFVIVRNTDQANHIDIDPNGSDTIDGLASINILPNEERMLICDGTNFISVVLTPFYVEVASSGEFVTPKSGYVFIEGMLWGAGAGGAAYVGYGYSGGGGGGACLHIKVPVADMDASCTVTIGAGGAGGSTSSSDSGTAGGNSIFEYDSANAKAVCAYGGGVGYAGAAAFSRRGGGGGGQLSAANEWTPGKPYDPDGADGDTEWDGTFGGGWGEYPTNNIAAPTGSVYGGGGAACSSDNNTTTVYGGAGGGGASSDGGSDTTTLGGSSMFGGDGGDGASSPNTADATASNGATPGGGGGGAAAVSGTATAGDGGDGLLRIWGVA